MTSSIFTRSVHREPWQNGKLTVAPLLAWWLAGTAFAWLNTLAATGASGPARFVTTPDSRSALEGELVLFEADADGTPPFQWQWFRAGVAIPGANQRTLLLAPVEESDDGIRYSVTVSNALGGAANSNALLTVQRGLLLSLSGNASVSPIVRRGWPLLLEISLLRRGAFDSNAMPVLICASNGPWPGAIAAEVVDSSGQPQTWPLHQQVITNDTLSLTAQTSGRVFWWLSDAETAQLPQGQFEMRITLNTTNVTKTNAWKGMAQSPLIDLTVTNEAVPLTESDAEEKYRLFADFATLQGDASAARVAIDTLLGAYSTNIGGLMYRADLQQAAGQFNDALDTVQAALDQADLQTSNPREPPTGLWILESELQQILAPPILEVALVGQQVLLSWMGRPEFTYRLQSSSDLSAWSDRLTNINVVSNRYSVIIPPVGQYQFFRLAR
jgi:hypothetical protein